jgi:hypothetical protein
VGLGRWVEVVAVEEPAGTLTALRMRGIVPLPAQEIWGAIQVADSDCWVLSSISLAVNDETLIVSVPQVGVLARAAAILQADGSLLAQRLLVSWLEVGVLHQPIEFTGTIEALPPKGLNGVWTVSGQTVNVIPATAINQEKGMAVVGAEVKIIGWQAPTRFTAVEITVLSSPLPGGEEVNFYGPIEAMPAEGPLGTWTIGGQQVIVNERTRLGGAEWAQIGLLAEGAGIRWADGTIVATWMMILPIPYPQPSAMPHL